MPEPPSPQPAVTRRIPLAIGAVLIGVGIGFAVIYGVGGLARDAGHELTQDAAEAAAGKDAWVHRNYIKKN